MTISRIRALVVDDEPIARAHLCSLLEQRGDVEVMGECGEGRSAVRMIREGAPDLVLLDVQMPELDGLAVVRDVGPDRMPAVVFVTAHDEHAVEAFEVHALDYLLKPVNRARFTAAIDRVVRLLQDGADHSPAHSLAGLVGQPNSRPGSERIAVKSGDRLLYLRLSDIDWIEAADDVIRLHVGRTVHDHRATMAQMEERLPSSSFVRIHRSTIVNIERIREFHPWFQGDWIVVLSDGTRLQSGRSYRARVRELLGRS
jgi:two-component system LytT family response regulator